MLGLVTIWSAVVQEMCGWTSSDIKTIKLFNGADNTTIKSARCNETQWYLYLHKVQADQKAKNSNLKRWFEDHSRFSAASAPPKKGIMIAPLALPLDMMN